MKMLLTSAGKIVIYICITAMLCSTPSCYHYRITTTSADPSTEYQKKEMWAYCWGLINKPQNHIVPNCGKANGLDEVRVTQNFGRFMLTLITLGIAAPVKVEWKCHKPCQRTDSL
jgi:hypothetical protein